MYRVSYYPCPNSWTKDFETFEEARTELLRHICSNCLTGIRTYIGEGGTLISEQTDKSPDLADVNSLLSTPCGCELGFEEI